VQVNAQLVPAHFDCGEWCLNACGCNTNQLRLLTSDSAHNIGWGAA
jgi:hypothetical protein